MRKANASPAVGKELEAMTASSGAALVGFGERTFVVVAVDGEPVQAPSQVYEVTDPDEASALRDALDDRDNPTLTTAEALAYLRRKRADRGRG